MKYLVKFKTTYKKNNTEENAVIEANSQAHALSVFEREIFPLSDYDSITIEPVGHYIDLNRFIEHY